MRALTIAAALLTVSVLTACADEIPAHVGQTPTVNVSVGEYETITELVFTATSAIPVYHRPSADISPYSMREAGSLVSALNWTKTENGQLWLYLGHRHGSQYWIRVGDTDLSVEAVHALPQMTPAPQTTQVVGSDGAMMVVEVLGVSESGEDIAVLLPGASDALWLAGAALWRPNRPLTMGIYHGPIAGRWLNWREAATPPIWAEVRLGSRGLALLPGGGEYPFWLSRARFPIFGRSLDADWIAIRFDAFAPPIAWVPVSTIQNEIDIDAMPIFLSTGLQVIDLDDSGRIVGSVIVDSPDSWEWRTESELLIGEYGEDESSIELWNPSTGETRLLGVPFVGDVSPDGKWAVRREWNSVDNTIADVILVSLDGGEELRFPEAHRTIPRDWWGSVQKWSPDSQWYLSVYYADEPRTFALGVDGRRVEIVMSRWAEEWPQLVGVDELHFLDGSGLEIDAPWPADILDNLPQHWSPGHDLGDGWFDPKWSPNGKWLLARRDIENDDPTNSFTDEGYAALPSVIWNGWGYNEIGVFDRELNLIHSFRGEGFQCGSSRHRADWSPEGYRIVIGRGYLSC